MINFLLDTWSRALGREGGEGEQACEKGKGLHKREVRRAEATLCCFAMRFCSQVTWLSAGECNLAVLKLQTTGQKFQIKIGDYDPTLLTFYEKM